MANRDAPHGFRPIRGPIDVVSLTLNATNSIIGIGDLIEQVNDGTVNRAQASSVVICGVALEPKAASSGGTILVNVHPDTVYEAQTDNGTGTITALAGVNLNANIVVGDASNGFSIMEIDENSGATTNTLPVKILRLYPAIDNAFGEFNKLECKINNHVYKSIGVAGV